MIKVLCVNPIYTLLTLEPRQVVARQCGLLEGVGQALQIFLFVIHLLLRLLLGTLPDGRLQCLSAASSKSNDMLDLQLLIEFHLSFKLTSLDSRIPG